MHPVSDSRQVHDVAQGSPEDRFSLHRTKADETYLVGGGKGPLEAYLLMLRGGSLTP